MSEDVRKLTPLQRIPLIVQGVKDGKSYGKIAEECGVHERTIYRDRESIPFTRFFNVIVDSYLSDLHQMERGDEKQRSTALSHKGLLVRAMLKSVIPSKIEANITGDNLSPIILFDPATAILMKRKEEEEEPEEE